MTNIEPMPLSVFPRGGYQTLINTALRAAVEQMQGQDSEDGPVTIAALRKVLREELAAG